MESITEGLTDIDSECRTPVHGPLLDQLHVLQRTNSTYSACVCVLSAAHRTPGDDLLKNLIIYWH